MANNSHAILGNPARVIPHSFSLELVKALRYRVPKNPACSSLSLRGCLPKSCVFRKTHMTAYIAFRTLIMDCNPRPLLTVLSWKWGRGFDKFREFAATQTAGRGRGRTSSGPPMGRSPAITCPSSETATIGIRAFARSRRSPGQWAYRSKSGIAVRVATALTARTSPATSIVTAVGDPPEPTPRLEQSAGTPAYYCRPGLQRVSRTDQSSIPQTKGQQLTKSTLKHKQRTGGYYHPENSWSPRPH